MLLLKNTLISDSDHPGQYDILIGAEKILSIEKSISVDLTEVEIIDLEGKAIFPGFIDQHIHIAGAGGGNSYSSMTPDVDIQDLVRCGSTTVVGLLGTDGSTRSLQALYAKTKSLSNQGLTAFMYTNYYGFPPITLTQSIQDDLIFIDNIIGCKIAISDSRSSFPTLDELARVASQVNIGGMISGKGGILHVHLGNLKTGMDPLFDLVNGYQIPIRLLSPTHVGRTEQLFMQSLEFAKMGGMIDITTGASKFTEPWKQVIIALENGVKIENITFSSDGHAGLGAQFGQNLGQTSIAPVNTNLLQVIQLINEGGIPPSQAFKIITSNPAHNLSLQRKGKIRVGYDADICCFDRSWNLTEVISRGHLLMLDSHILTDNKDILIKL